MKHVKWMTFTKNTVIEFVMFTDMSLASFKLDEILTITKIVLKMFTTGTGSFTKG